MAPDILGQLLVAYTPEAVVVALVQPAHLVVPERKAQVAMDLLEKTGQLLEQPVQ